MEERFHALAVVLLRKRRVTLGELERLLKISSEMLDDVLSGLPVSLEGDEVVVVDAADLLLAFWKKGLDPVELALKAGWRDFERLCAKILDACGFETLLNVRLKAFGRIRELDVVALREPWLLAVDCKRWARRRESNLRVAARNHRSRCELLSREGAKMALLAAKVAKWREVRVIPVIVGVHEAIMRVFEGVPIVPLRKLPSFLNEFVSFEDELYVVKMMLK